MQWLIEYSAWQITTRTMGNDGVTAYQRVKGRTTDGPRVIGLGERCHFKKRAHEPAIPESNWRWSRGHWLGIDPKTGQYVIWDGDSIKMTRTINMTDKDKAQ